MSLLTAELQNQKGQGGEIAESPFASMSQQSSGTSSQDVSPDGSVSGGTKAKAGLEILVQLGTGRVANPH